jgi:hypothetical protein
MKKKENYINMDDESIKFNDDESDIDLNDDDKYSNNIVLDGDDIEIVSDDIEIDEGMEDYISEDSVSEMEGNTDFDLIYRLNTNKHRQEGKHRLKRDTIFKGKIDEKNDEDNQSHINSDCYNDSLKIDIEYDGYTNDYLNQNNLTKDVYDILDNKTNLDFNQNRRKPNRETFNNYYNLLLKDLGFRYTKSEIFVELSYYFTDNIFNMFKLLDKRPATIIIKELIQKGYLKNINNIDFL